MANNDTTTVRIPKTEHKRGSKVRKAAKAAKVGNPLLRSLKHGDFYTLGVKWVEDQLKAAEIGLQGV